jgi:hypothetical protein
MALNYPGYVVPQPSQTKVTDLLDLWDQGVAQGKADRYEREAPQQFANAAAPLSQYGLTTPPDQLRALFANPDTRPLALQMVQEATQRRADAYASPGQLGGTARTPQPTASTSPYAPYPLPREARPSPPAQRGYAFTGFTGGDSSSPANWERP